MRISDRLAPLALVFGALLLAGCEQPGVSGSTATRTTVTAGGQRVTIAAPAGFCVDGRSTSVTSTGAFVLMSDCALLGQPGAVAGRPPIGAALTASVSPTGLGDAGPATRSLGDLEQYARTPEGRALIGRGGQSAGVRVIASEERGGVLYVLVEDRGARQPIPGLDARFWRAFLEVNGRLTALSELGFAGAELSQDDGLNLIAAFATAIQRANAAPAAAAPAG